MAAAEQRVSLGAPPDVVWRLLMDFSTYAAWHPFVRLKGEPRLGEIAYTYSSSLAPDRVLRAPATITRLDAGRWFEWQSGVRLLFRTIESFALEPQGAGTLLTHRLEYRGALPALLRGGLTRKASDMVARTSQSLAAHLAMHRSKDRPNRAGPGPASARTTTQGAGKRRGK